MLSIWLFSGLIAVVVHLVILGVFLKAVVRYDKESKRDNS
jgi:hypothetical protein